MKKILFFILILLSPYSYSENLTQLSGLWKNSIGKYYSMHQIEDSIVIAELNSQTVELGAFEQGNISFTDNILDVAINGAGFFVLEKSDGSLLYSRDGKFHISAEGWIVNKDGYKLVTAKGLTIPSSNRTENSNRKFIISDQLIDCISIANKSNGQCPTITNNQESIVISQDGFIKLLDYDSGELVEHDQIILASFFKQHLRISGDYYSSSDPEAVVYSSSSTEVFVYPGTVMPGILQSHALEIRTYVAKTWRSFTGEIVDNSALLSPSDSYQYTDWYEKEIQFSSNTKAIIKKSCSNQNTSFCEMEEVKDEALTKIF